MTTHWNPNMEEAPRDGTEILLVGKFEEGPVRFVASYDASEISKGTGPHGPFTWRRWDADSVAEFVPYAWQPLDPIPPKQGEAE